MQISVCNYINPITPGAPKNGTLAITTNQGVITQNTLDQDKAKTKWTKRVF